MRKKIVAIAIGIGIVSLMPLHSTVSNKVLLLTKSANNISNTESRKVLGFVTTTVRVENKSGKILYNEYNTGFSGMDIYFDPIQIENWYQIAQIRVNGKEIAQNKIENFKLPTKLGDSNEDITYIVSPASYEAKVKLIESDGKILESTSTGYSGEKITYPKVPKGYKVVDVQVNGRYSEGNMVPVYFTDKNLDIVAKLEKIVVVKDYKVNITINGGEKSIEKNIEGINGSKIEVPSIAKDYKVDSVYLNNKKIKYSEIPKIIDGKNLDIKINISKIEKEEPIIKPDIKPEPEKPIIKPDVKPEPEKPII
ncbi:hypothetical protein, partial [uncultured Clostridium sp.]|uniref:hypothetical protein n=1 Tax=uncultured Clostridium sp. TaxID=59620 RepID=UPI002628696B